MNTGIEARVFDISQFEYNPQSGESLNFTEENIKAGLAHKSIKRYAYIKHDKDVHTQHEYDEYVKKHGDEPYWQIGTDKGDHWHIAIECPNKIKLSAIAKWFGVPENQINLPKGSGAFLDCVEYLTHETEKQQSFGKYRYDDADVIANFDWRSELQQRQERRLKYGRDLNSRDRYRYDVMYNGKTLAECQKEDAYNLMNDLTYLQKCRSYYLVNCAPLPSLRINIYIDGPGGIGKNTASRAIAKALYPDVDNCFYEVGGKNVSFDNYDGEPVIIWNDYRSVDLVTRWGRGEVFDILDSHPTNSTHNIKYGKIRLINSVNIINGIEPYEEFLDGLAGEYTDKDGNEYEAEDKTQSYRRVPIIICLRETDYDVLLNQGVALGTREYEQYIGYRNIVGSFARVVQRLDGIAKEKVLIDMTQPVLDCVDKIKAYDVKKYIKIEDVPTEFDNYGKVPPIIDTEVTVKKQQDSLIGLVQYQQNEISKLQSENTDIRAELLEARSAARENIYKQATTAEKKEIKKQYFSRPA